MHVREGVGTYYYVRRGESSKGNNSRFIEMRMKIHRQIEMDNSAYWLENEGSGEEMASFCTLLWQC